MVSELMLRSGTIMGMLDVAYDNNDDLNDGEDSIEIVNLVVLHFKCKKRIAKSGFRRVADRKIAYALFCHEDVKSKSKL